MIEDPLSWYAKTFEICEHELVRGYCAACSAAADEAEKRAKKAAKADVLERENARLRRLLGSYGISE